MRLQIEFVVVGKDLNEIIDNIRTTWKSITGDLNEPIPQMTEVKVSQDKVDAQLVAYVTTRTKVD